MADVFDALTSICPYKRALSNEEACNILMEGRGTHLDPQIVDLFFANLDKIKEIQARYLDVSYENTHLKSIMFNFYFERWKITGSGGKL